jgi:hypothetical protein
VDLWVIVWVECSDVSLEVDETVEEELDGLGWWFIDESA